MRLPAKIPKGERHKHLTIVREIQSVPCSVWRMVCGKMRHYVYNVRRVECVCDCGVVKDYFLYSVRKKNGTESCGCMFRARKRLQMYKHGLTGTPFRGLWNSMKERCKANNIRETRNHGDRGIRVCDEWKDFMNFKNDMFEGYEDHCKKYGRRNTTIERIDNNGDYCKENCRWATWKEQANNRRTNTIISFMGMAKTGSQWADFFDIRIHDLWNHLKRGKSLFEAVIGRL